MTMTIGVTEMGEQKKKTDKSNDSGAEKGPKLDTTSKPPRPAPPDPGLSRAGKRSDRKANLMASNDNTPSEQSKPPAAPPPPPPPDPGMDRRDGGDVTEK